jgi:hypothetical protein
MQKTVAWHSVAERVYHNDLRCTAGSAIPADLRREGTGGKKICPDCARFAEPSPRRTRD